MRGLEIRTEYATAKVLANVLGGDQVDFALWPFVDDAWCLGHDDYDEGVDEAPLLFKNEPELLTAWKQGWSTAYAAR